MSTTYAVHPYHIDKLIALLVERSDNRASPFVVKEKLHTEYFKEYFSSTGVNAHTIVVENDYVDRDFLDDFAGYYVRCFQEYRHTCSRLHFFDFDFSEAEFTEAISGKGVLTDAKLQEGYLGFVVVKPLPQTIIGRTCLKTYSPDAGRRVFPFIRKYDANLFGIPLHVEQTLAFQEQDSVVAACASSALWSAFHATGIMFHHRIPSPVEITNSATKYLPLETRTFPNQGLSALQMSYAIREVGLEPVYFDTKHEATLKSLIYGYLKGGLPVVMGVELWDVSDQANPTHKDEDYHAVTITGYSLPTAAVPVPDPDTGTLFTASGINELYAHDDQVGPFARMLFDGITIPVCANGQINNLFSLHTSWRGRNTQIGSIRAVPYMLLVPVYHKIRIPLGAVKRIVGAFDTLLQGAQQQGAFALGGQLHWSVYLTTINETKKSIRSSKILLDKVRVDLLCANSPRFIWRASCALGGTTVLDLLFDATDIEQSDFFYNAVVYDVNFGQSIKAICTPALLTRAQGASILPIVKWFSKL